MIKQPVFAIIAAVLFAAVAFFALKRAYFLSSAARTEGIIASVSAYNDTCGSSGGRRRRSSRYPCTKFTAEVSYRDQQQKQYSTSLSAGSTRGTGQSTGMASYRAGESVELIYDPNNPSYVFKDTFFDVWGFPCLLALFAGVSLVVSLFEFRPRRSAW